MLATSIIYNEEKLNLAIYFAYNKANASFLVESCWEVYPLIILLILLQGWVNKIHYSK